jgi:glycine/D-amino acid oxidase-like deaminating enzyme/nitrite reductase/ring-hydroxylating ferredoxin subunit
MPYFPPPRNLAANRDNGRTCAFWHQACSNPGSEARMNTVQQQSLSLWQNEDSPFFPCLQSPEAVDVCVIGGGIAGLTTAYHLLKSGRSVAVLERGDLGGETVLSSGHLTSVLDQRYFRLSQVHGDLRAALAAASHAFAVEEIGRISRVEHIECDFRMVPGFLFLGTGDDEELLPRELEACRAVGLRGAEFLTNSPNALFNPGPALRFPDQARFHPGRYLAGLARAIQRKGGKICSNTEATAAHGGRPARVPTNRGFEVVCEAIVVASNVPFNDSFTMQTKMAPYRSYVLSIEIPETRNTDALYWDTADPYHYVRTFRESGGQCMALVGGCDHRTGQETDSDPYQRLAGWAKNRLGITGAVRHHWSGQILEPHDGLAFIGKNPGDHGNVFIATGFAGNGLTYGTIAGRLLTDLLNGVKNEWAETYSPSRISLRTLGTFLAENARTAAPYTDWVTGGDVDSVEEIPAGEGAVIRDGAQKLAVYKDPRGCPHYFSAVCPHLSGLVRWNTSEKTWDCPCHGSRFDKLGNVLNGPANLGLAEIVDTSLRDENAVSA